MDHSAMQLLDCTDIRALLSGIVDDQLDIPTRHEAERHLAACDSCRALVNRVETLDELVVRDAAALGGDVLPTGFVDSVLRQTVYSGSSQVRLRPFLFPLLVGSGALAAAAAVAVTLLPTGMLGSNFAPTSSATGDAVVMAMPLSSHGGIEFSLIADSGALPEVTDSTPEEPVVALAPDPEIETTHSSITDSTWASSAFTSMAFSEPVNVDDPAVTFEPATDAILASTLTPEETQTLYSAAILLDMLSASDDGSFAVADQVRRIAEYDELLGRLREVRPHLPADQQAMILAAESVLTRVIHGPMSQDDLRDLRNVVAQLELPHRMNSLSNQG